MKKLTAFFLLLVSSICALAGPGPGNGWTVETLDEGLVYYTFSGIDNITCSAQRVYAIDLDLNNPSYAFRFNYTAENIIPSDVMKKRDALVVMNAGYEASSIAIKVDGIMYSNAPFDYVFTSPVPNWKSEAAIYTDGGRDVKIAFEGKNRNLAQLREFYASVPEANLLTSAPMLIDDYKPVGVNFADVSLIPDLTALHYEDPIRHQGVRHPRSAVAKTGDNHLVLIAVDGRRLGVSEGMSAKELTLFIAKHFNPRYAINMDGGGSTTLCVKGHGDPETCVVNYPTDNKKHDHAGERARDTQFYIVKLSGKELEESASIPSEKPRLGVREEVRADWNKSSGLDCVYDMTAKPSTPAPKGYKPVYISHYGRHGSRYAYTDQAYTTILELLRKGDRENNLTEYGKWLLGQTEQLWEKVRYRVGDLTPLGWEQHRYIAATMVKSFPGVFGKGSRVDACASPSVRAIISMNSCCTSIAREAPATSIYAHQSTMDMHATRPNTSKNPRLYKTAESIFPYSESPEQFFQRRFPDYDKVLSRLFKDTSSCLGDKKPYDVFFMTYMFAAGMNSLQEDEKFDVSGLFTVDEYATLWETDNYARFWEYVKYRGSCSSILDDIMTRADARLAEGSRGADLRFGHDHVMMALLMVSGLEGFGNIPPCPDDLVYWFQSFRSCKGTNMQWVFYTSAKGEPLVKVLLNGEEARIGNLKPVSGPYYSWEAVKGWLNSRIDQFVISKN